ncbi:hypothetical protein EDC96DRAFT_576057 [Choanephora cucurbitarum]|nr:hypothetical protein EDC96DRAFT_576057 [Choanephora cucurbitarum]
MPVSVEKDATDEESGESDESDESTDEAEDEGQAGSSKSQNDDPSSSSNFKRGRKRHLDGHPRLVFEGSIQGRISTSSHEIQTLAAYNDLVVRDGGAAVVC